MKVTNPFILSIRDAGDPARTLLSVQAQDMMGLRPPEGEGVDCRILARGKWFDSGFSDFWSRSARNGADITVLDNFEDFQKNYQINVPKKHYNCISRPFRPMHFCIRTFEKSQISYLTFKISISASGRSILC